jgi:hypothetical protein
MIPRPAGAAGHAASPIEMEDGKREEPGLALKIGIAGALAIGAIASGFFMSRRGRRVLKEAFEGRRRTRVEDRVLDALWGDSVIGRRAIEVEELGNGIVAISGTIRNDDEHRRVLTIAGRIPDVRGIEDHLAIDPGLSRRRRRRDLHHSE